MAGGAALRSSLRCTPALHRGRASWGGGPTPGALSSGGRLARQRPAGCRCGLCAQPRLGQCSPRGAQTPSPPQCVQRLPSLTNYIVVAIDEELAAYCKEKGINHYHRPVRIPDSQKDTGSNHAISAMKVPGAGQLGRRGVALPCRALRCRDLGPAAGPESCVLAARCPACVSQHEAGVPGGSPLALAFRRLA